MNSLTKGSGEREILFTMKGLLFYMILTLDEKDQDVRAVDLFLYEVCKRLALNGYGKSTIKIRQEIKDLRKDEVPVWVENVFGRFISDAEMAEIFNSLSTT